MSVKMGKHQLALSVGLGVAGSLFMAGMNVILDRKLTKINPLATLVISNIVVVALGLTTWILIAEKFNPGQMEPAAKRIIWILIAGACIFFGDLCFNTAYVTGKQGAVLYLTPMMGLIPVFATVVTCFWDRKWPTPLLIGAWILALCAGILVGIDQHRRAMSQKEHSVAFDTNSPVR